MIQHRVALATAVAVFAAAVLAFRWIRRAAAFWTIDDSAITYSAAFELADHHSLAPFLEGTPVESYSNPLVFFVVTVLRFFGLFDPIATHFYIEAALFATMVLLVWLVLRSFAGEIAAVAGTVAFAAVELLTPATWVWYGSGLENVWVSTGLVALIWICVRTARGVPLHPGWGAVAGAVALTRPEAPVYVAAFYLALFGFARPPEVSLKAHAKQVGYALAVTAAIFIAFIAWRRFAYSSWLPNTYFAKVPGHTHFKDHLRANVLGELLRYYRAGFFACGAFALAMHKKTESLGQVLIAMLLAALVLPITADQDWMGDERFGTAFIAVAHVAYGVVVAICIAPLVTSHPRTWRAGPVFTVVMVLVVGGLLKYDGVKAQPPVLNPVTTPWVGTHMGGERWEHQARLGLPNPVVLDPDVGGALLVGALQLVDNGFLADYEMAHLSHDDHIPHDFRIMSEYENVERVPDLLNDNPAWPIDRAYLGPRYVQGPDGLWARRDLVAGDVPPDAQLLIADGSVSVYLSPDTVRTGAPHSLIRCEVYVVWSSVLTRGTHLHAKIDHGDKDDIALFPYQQVERGTERRALLLGAPAKPGTYTVSLSLERPGMPALPAPTFTIDVVADRAVVGQRATELAAAGTPIDAARRVAWLREQRVPRLGMTEYHLYMNDLRGYDRDHSKTAGAVLLLLRDNARLGTLEDLPAGLRAAETTVMHRMLATCPAGGADEVVAANRAVCLGRAVDQLRRLGYLGVLDRVPELARELAQLRDSSERFGAAQRYRVLVAYTLAKPSDIAAQRELLTAREAAAKAPAFPPL